MSYSNVSVLPFANPIIKSKQMTSVTLSSDSSFKGISISRELIEWISRLHSACAVSLWLCVTASYYSRQSNFILPLPIFFSIALQRFQTWYCIDSVFARLCACCVAPEGSAPPPPSLLLLLPGCRQPNTLVCSRRLTVADRLSSGVHQLISIPFVFLICFRSRIRQPPSSW